MPNFSFFIFFLLFIYPSRGCREELRRLRPCPNLGARRKGVVKMIEIEPGPRWGRPREGRAICPPWEKPLNCRVKSCVDMRFWLTPRGVRVIDSRLSYVGTRSTTLARSEPPIFERGVAVFIISIFMLISRPSIISFIIGREGLGMSSFALILFYQNKKSIRGRMYTLIMPVVSLSSKFFLAREM